MFEKIDDLRGCGEREMSAAIGGGGGGMIPLSGLATKSTTRSWVAFRVATASSCVTFSRFLSPCWNQYDLPLEIHSFLRLTERSETEHISRYISRSN